MMHSVNYTRVKSHYHSLLSQHYTWTFGGGGAKQSNNYKLLSDYLKDGKGKIAVDLGCGSGFQSIPLMQLGYHVYCVDSSTQLLEELKENAPNTNYTLVETDMLSYTHKADVVVCMGDSITHLANLDEVELLLRNVYEMLDGLFFISFRDLTVEMFDCDRFIPVRSDERTVFTCFLEWKSSGNGCLVKITDLVHVKKGIGAWELCTSWYEKLGISIDWLRQKGLEIGFTVLAEGQDQGMEMIIFKK